MVIIFWLWVFFANETCKKLPGETMTLNYGFNKIRFLSPVRPINYIRGGFRLINVTIREPYGILQEHEMTIEMKNQEKPAIIAH